MRRVWLACALGAAACAAEPSLPSAALGDGAGAVEIGESGRAIALTRGGRTLLTFPADGFQLGTVDQLSKTASYDPYWLEWGGSDGAPPPKPAPDLRWRDVP